MNEANRDRMRRSMRLRTISGGSYQLRAGRPDRAWEPFADYRHLAELAMALWIAAIRSGEDNGLRRTCTAYPDYCHLQSPVRSKKPAVCKMLCEHKHS
jgi:hypothetical protein